MEQYLIFDLAILAVLLVFALLGARRGLVLSLCSLVAVLAAFAGGALASRMLSPMVAGLLEQPLTSAIETRLEEAIRHTEFVSQTGGVAERPEEVSLAGVLDILEDMGLHGSLINSIREAVESGMDSAAAGAAAQVGAACARSLASLLVFLAAFVIILVLWALFSRTLDLVARLPGLHTLNRAGGFLFGALKGCVFLFVAAWLARWLWGGLIPDDAVERSRLLRFFLTTNPLEMISALPVQGLPPVGT